VPLPPEAGAGGGMSGRPATALGADALTSSRALSGPVLAALIGAGHRAATDRFGRYAARPAGRRVMPPARLYAS
jgi:hypothetical protein